MALLWRARRSLAAKEPIELAFHDAVAVAGRRFPSRPSADGDPATPIADDRSSLQRTSRLAGRAAIDAQRLREAFLRALDLIGVRAVLRRQEPAAEALLDGVELAT